MCGNRYVRRKKCGVCAWERQRESNRQRANDQPGVDTMTAMKIVGHKSEKMRRRYNQIHITPDDVHEAMAKFGMPAQRLE